MSETLVIFVSGRGALAELAGVPSVERHVQAGKTLGLDVVVVYPSQRRALGAEIRGFVHEDADCIPADQFEARAASLHFADDHVLVVAAEWYLALAALIAVRDSPSLRVFGRVCERGRISVPVARVSCANAIAVAAHLGSTSAAAALAALPTPDDESIDLDSRSEQRLSDNISTAHAEEKLIRTVFGPHRILPVLRLRPIVAPRLARALSHTVLGPTRISAVKLLLGLAAAWILAEGSYASGVAGASLYFLARLLGAAGIVLARASLVESEVREKLDLAGDTVLHIALLWALAGGAARGHGAIAAALLATIGVLLSTGVAYVFVVHESWQARKRDSLPALGERVQPTMIAARAHHSGAAGDEFVSRFVQRDGIAYALLFAALVGSLDLFLWAAAVASHLFYVLWLLARPRGQHGQSGPMAVGRPA